MRVVVSIHALCIVLGVRRNIQYADAETVARAERRGLWRDLNTPVPPWEFRRNPQK